MKEFQAVASQKKAKAKSKNDQKINISQIENKTEILTAKENFSEKKIRKIKIRLLDPSDPSSYACEFFDSSLENDETQNLKTNDISENNESSFDECTIIENPKPKDYFDILMSSESRKTFTNNTGLQNEEIPKAIRLFRKSGNMEEISKQKFTKEKKKEYHVEFEKKSVNCNTSLDDENILQVQSKLNFNMDDSEKESTGHSSKKISDSKKNKENKSASVFNHKSYDTSNVIYFSSKNKPANLLSYFSKAETNVKKINLKVKTTKINVFNGRENKILNNKKNTELQEEHSEALDIEIIKIPDLREKSHELNSIKKVEKVESQNLKLAPLFQKKVKNNLDPSVMKARLDFLRNGIPTNTKKQFQNQKVTDLIYPEMFFPKIAHVQQIDDCTLHTSKTTGIPLLKLQREDHDFSSSRKIFRFLISNFDVVKKKNVTSNTIEERNFSSLKAKYKILNFESIFKGLKEKNVNFSKRLDPDNSSIKKSKVGNKNSKEASARDDAEACDVLWTEKYKPKSSEIIGNKSTVDKLRKWLKSWKDYDIEIQKLNGLKNEVVLDKVTDFSDESDDDSVFLSDGERLGVRAPINICFISGPVSSGKTSLIYGLASELEFNVLEANASSKRTGRKLLMDLQEATKSHKIKNGYNHQPLNENEKKKKSKINKFKKKKKKKRFEKADCPSGQPKDSKMSLILIEDADIYFEDHDEGFVSAILTLIHSSKRPFIFLLNDPNCVYLEKLKVQNALVLKMNRPNFHSSCAVLDSIAVLEGVTVEEKHLESLIENNQCDLRKSILELQFWIQYGKGVVLDYQRPFELGKLWWGFNKFLYKKDHIHNLKLNNAKRKRTSELYDSSSDEIEEPHKKLKLNEINSSKVETFQGSLNNKKIDSSIHVYSKILDSISMSDLLIKLDCDSEPIPSRHFKPKDSLSLSEHKDSVDWQCKELSVQILKELINISANNFAHYLGDEFSSRYDLCCPTWSEIRWRNKHKDAQLDLMSLLPLNGRQNKRAANLDYLPVIRNICRTEKNRYLGNTKRKNRFYHYFKNLGSDPQEESLDISCHILGN